MATTAQFDLLFRVQGSPEVANMQAQLKALGAATANAQAKFNGFGTSAANMNNAMANVNRGSGQLASRMQNAAFQVTDFVTQVQGGVSATRALSQQLPQLLGSMGALGAVIGAAAAVLLPFAANLTIVQENLDRIIGYATGLAAVMGGKFLLGITASSGGFLAAAKAAAAFALTLQGLKTIIISTGLGAIAIFIGEAVAAFIRLKEQTGSWGKAAQVVFGAVRGFAINVMEVFQNIGLAGKAGWSAFSSAALSAISYVLESIATMSAGIRDFFASLGADTIASGLGSITSSVEAAAQSVANSSASYYRDAGNAWDQLSAKMTANADGLKLLQAFTANYKGTLGGAAEEAGKFGKGVAGSTGAISAGRSKLDEYRQSLESARTPMQALTAELQKAELYFKTFGQFLTPEEYQLAVQQIDGLKAKIAELNAEGGTKLGELGAKLVDIGTQITNSFANGVTDAFMAMVEGTASAKDAFKAMAVSLLKDITRLIIQSMVLFAIQKALGFVGGSIGGGFGSALTSIAGGLGRSGAMGVAPQASGPVTPSAFSTGTVPSNVVGRIIPTMEIPSTSSAAKPQAPQMQVVINNNSSAQVSTRQSDGKLFVEIAEYVKNNIASDMIRGGGQFDRAMKSGYGIARVGR